MGQVSRRASDYSEDAVENPAPDRVLFAEFLVSARRRAGCSIDDIALVTKVPVRHLEALEQGRIDELPRGVYRRAIVRTYSAAIGLDPTIVVERFAQVFGSDSAFSEWQTVPSPARPRPAALVRVSSPAVVASPSTIPTPRRVSAGVVPSSSRQRGLWTAAVAVGGALLAATVGFLIVQSEGPTAPVGGAPGSERVQVPVAAAASPARVVDRVLQTSATTEPPTASSRPDTLASAPADEQLAEPAPVETRLVITSNPSGARVTIDGIGWGVTPITVRHLPPGPKSVRATKDGYIGQEQQIQLGEDGAAAVRLTLVARP